MKFVTVLCTRKVSVRASVSRWADTVCLWSYLPPPDCLVDLQLPTTEELIHVGHMCLISDMCQTGGFGYVHTKVLIQNVLEFMGSTTAKHLKMLNVRHQYLLNGLILSNVATFLTDHAAVVKWEKVSHLHHLSSVRISVYTTPFLKSGFHHPVQFKISFRMCKFTLINMVTGSIFKSNY